MPKKTKKQKLKAIAHRHAHSPVAASITSSPSQSPIIPSSPVFSYTPARTHSASLIHDEKALKTDIVKTVLLVTVILVIELLLSRYLS